MSAQTRICSALDCDRSAYGRGCAFGMCSKHYKRWRRHGDPNGGRISDGETARFFRENVTRDTADCVEWPYAKSSGYGCATIDGRRDRVHVLACEMIHGPRPSEEHEAAHGCGNALCFNPRHLRWATRRENVADSRKHGTIARGERSGSARLTADGVRDIRAHPRGPVNARSLVQRYGVSRNTIYDIWARRTWGWLDV